MVVERRTHSVFELANPKRFMDVSAQWLPWLAVASALALLSGLYLGIAAPPEASQGPQGEGDTVKIMFLHVPAAWTAMMAYGLLATASFVSIVFRHPLADVAAKAAAPLGAAFTALGLVTGALWGEATWGTYFLASDIRLLSFAFLLLLYVGYIALWNAFEDEARAARVCAILALIGIADLVLIEVSVEEWFQRWTGIMTLHQGPSIVRPGGPAISAVFLWPLALSALGYTLLFFSLWIVRIRTVILEKQIRAELLGYRA